METASVQPAVLDYAEKNGVDLIALTTHGRGGAARLIVGSVADKVVRGAQVPVLLYRHEEDAGVDDVSRDGTLVAISHSEHGDSRHPAVRLLALDGTPVADLWDGEGRGLEVLGFCPVPGDPRAPAGCPA